MKLLIVFSLFILGGRAALVAPSIDEIRREGFDFVPSNFTPSVHLTLDFFTSFAQFRHCCKWFTHWSTSVNPNIQSVLKPVELRNEPTYSVENITSFGSWYNMYRTRYFLMMYTPEDYSVIPHQTRYRPEQVHWIVSNVTLKGFPRENETIVPYTAPSVPFGEAPRHFVFLLYEPPPWRISADEMRRKHYGEWNGSFILRRFTDVFSLKLRGITWFKVRNDNYTNYVTVKNANSSSVEARYCEGWRGWTRRGCVTLGAGMVQMSSALLLLPFVLLAGVLQYRA